ncbi:hypothetical protein BCR44DRAFT_1438168 [Catenaria anguillulae PL171]|uniref:SNF2 family N-terminal domain-domain-containing protein n=1 Tax=Catenaria anguillulae PL171 TaxID=765915 RepID=A0A1Y2HHR5_9FUNG|nr:hypothetical protein BCR44DRAFT_1438168 [Catenaria anguillulae PL171]
MSQQPPTPTASNTRIDKLFTILDTASATPALKAAATLQLAQLARQGHPLASLFRRLLPLLRSKTWATRAAAASALEAIAKESPWTCGPLDQQQQQLGKGNPDMVQQALDAHAGQWINAVDALRAFDFDAVTSRSPPLLAGNKGTHDADGSNSSDAGHAAQRAYLVAKLGGSAEAAGAAMEHQDTASSSDSASAPSTPTAAAPLAPPTSTAAPAKRGRKPKSVAASTPPPPSTTSAHPTSASSSSAKKPAFDDVASIEQALSDPALSAREKNALRRKLKVMKKNGSGSSGAAGAGQPPPSKKVRRMESFPAGSDDGGMASGDDSFDAPAASGPAPVPIIKQEAAAAGPVVPAVPEKVVVSYKGPPVKQEQEDGMDVVQDPGDELTRLGFEPWPFQSLCDVLYHDLLDPAWEVRHGAAMGIRETVKVQGRLAGTLSPLPIDKAALLNHAYLTHLATRLLHVLCRDRFSDFIGDTVTVPVRESAAQALGVIVKHLPEPLVALVHDRLITLTSVGGGAGQHQWSLQLAAYLGLKYLLAVRHDLLAHFLPLTFPTILQGLAHEDDDVRAVAASTLLPIATSASSSTSLADTLTDDHLTHLLSILAHCLAHCDDLSASTAAVMDLVATLSSSPRVADMLVPLDPAKPAAVPLAQLVKAMCMLIRHPLSSVRLAVLSTLEAFVRMEQGRVPSQARWWIGHELVRYVYQNLLVEEASPDVLDASLALWRALVAYLAGCGALVHIFAPLVKALLQLALTPIGTGLPVELMVGGVQGLDRAMVEQDLQVVGIDDILRGRLRAAQALGCLMAWWPAASLDGAKVVVGELDEYLVTPWAGQRVLASLVVVAYAHERRTRAEGVAQEAELPGVDVDALVKTLAGIVDGALAPAAGYTELRAHLLRVYSECLHTARDHAIQLPPLEQFTLPAAQALVAFHPGLQSTIHQYVALEALLDARARATAAAALIALDRVPSKVAPLVRSLTAVLKVEENVEVQDVAARAVGELARTCVKAGKGGVVDKLVKNLGVMVCSDAEVTPVVSEWHATQAAASGDVMTLVKESAAAGGNGALPTTTPATATSAVGAAGVEEAAAAGKKRKRAAAGESSTAASDPTISAAAALAASTVAVNPNRITHRGAELAFHAIAREFGPDLFCTCPISPTLVDTPDQVEAVQAVVDALQLNASVCAAVDQGLHSQLLAQVHAMIGLLDSPLALVRYMSARGVAAMAQANPSGTLHGLVVHVLPKLQSSDPSVATPNARRGAVECIHHVSQALGASLLPYVVFLVVPLMGAMSDFDDEVRRLASASFAHLIQLVPELVKQRASERAFLGQLLGTQKPEKFEVPVKLKGVELRPYQHEGVNWMMFLNRYQLHGILCDDMGLGKTLQTITVLSSHHQVQSTNRPSLVVCPSTLTGHWQHEINKYSPNLRPVVYAGPPQERRRLQAQMRNPPPNTVIITSYEVVRNDFEALGAMGGGANGNGNAGFEYCVLDEGHVIRNAKTKLTQTVKTLKARHRLLLSGTPIQNNVLELWSLFDFLMPGFLGTEQQFNARFAKKILASRDAKKSSAEQEAGMRALKDLHRQVLPFAKFYKDVVEAADPSTKTHVFQALQAMRRICNHPVLHVGALQQQRSASYSPTDPMLHTLDNAPKLAALKQLLEDCGIGTSVGSSSGLASSVSGRPRHENGSSASATAAGNSAAVVDSLANHRVLVFAQMKQMLDLIESDLFRAHMPSVSYLRLDGSTDPRARHGIVTRFNDDPSIDVLLLTTQAGGLGLNLTGADTVIFVDHDWNPMRDLQAMDRAHRLGQKRVVNVYRLIARGTLEEKIMGLQRFKMHIAGQVVNQQNAALDSMETDQLLDLFNVAGTMPSAAGNGSGKGASGAGASGVAAAIVEGLDELAQREYDDEYNMDAFLGSI